MEQGRTARLSTGRPSGPVGSGQSELVFVELAEALLVLVLAAGDGEASVEGLLVEGGLADPLPLVDGASLLLDLDLLSLR